MSKRGRPTVLDETKKSEILAILSTGCNRQTAANYVDCAPKTIYNTALRDPKFAKKLSRMETSSEVVHLVNVNIAARNPSYWRASAWALERLLPKRYGQRKPDTVTPEQLEGMMKAFAEIAPEENSSSEVPQGGRGRSDEMRGGIPQKGRRKKGRGKKSAAKTHDFSSENQDRLANRSKNPKIQGECRE
jgi:hypothetical protein